MKTWDKVASRDPIVNAGLRAGLKLEEIIVLLVEQKDAILRQAMELDRIVPRKFKTPDGRCFVWRCPDELIPLSGQ